MMPEDSMLSTYQERVGRFMLAAGQIEPHHNDATPVQRERRIHMLREEVEELAEAYADNDRVEIEDAIGDILYVLLGAAVEESVSVEGVMDEVCDSNDSKIDWKNRRPWATHPNGKVAKGGHYRAPKLGKNVWVL